MTSGSMVTWRYATNGLRIVIVALVLAAAIGMQFLSDKKTTEIIAGGQVEISGQQAK